MSIENPLNLNKLDKVSDMISFLEGLKRSQLRVLKAEKEYFDEYGDTMSKKTHQNFSENIAALSQDLAEVEELLAKKYQELKEVDEITQHLGNDHDTQQNK